jgi:hypothetical protein
MYISIQTYLECSLALELLNAPVSVHIYVLIYVRICAIYFVHVQIILYISLFMYINTNVLKVFFGIRSTPVNVYS